MGLSINAFRQIKPSNAVWDEDADCYRDPETKQEVANVVAFWVNKDFPGREDGIKHQAPYSYTEEFYFSAGSYGGYGDWREQLAIMAGWAEGLTVAVAFKAEEHPASRVAWSAESGPFWELINFADNEGVIGTTHCIKLAADFASHQALIDAIEEDDQDVRWFKQKYADWRKAFEMAADGGAVKFK